MIDEDRLGLAADALGELPSPAVGRAVTIQHRPCRPAGRSKARREGAADWRSRHAAKLHPSRRSCCGAEAVRRHAGDCRPADPEHQGAPCFAPLSPRPRARPTAWATSARDPTPSFSKTFDRWLSIVFSRQEQLGGDLAVRVAGGHELGDLPLAAAEAVEPRDAGGARAAGRPRGCPRRRSSCAASSRSRSAPQRRELGLGALELLHRALAVARDGRRPGPARVRERAGLHHGADLGGASSAPSRASAAARAGSSSTPQRAAA